MPYFLLGTQLAHSGVSQNAVSAKIGSYFLSHYRDLEQQHGTHAFLDNNKMFLQAQRMVRLALSDSGRGRLSIASHDHMAAWD